MHPVFFEFKSFVIHTYGIMAALGFLFAIMVSGFLAKKENIKKNEISDLAVYIILSAIIGARVFYFFVEPEYFLKNPIEIFKIWKGGLVFYGGFVFGLLGAFIFIKKRKLPFGKTADIIAPALALGHGIGRIGCFFAGCCYGRPTELPIGIVFKNPEALAPLNLSLHPVQIYSVLSNFFLFAVLIFFYKRKKNDGDVFLLYLFLYGILRMIIEYFRGDNRGEFILGVFSLSQFIGFLAVISAVLIYLFKIMKHKTLEK
ncbi:MAG: prolipoprotein diacylglyceryl transferase [Desulforegulaceae bacterium]|nr:prolipoprotein diacylglyceryl transferase [Desulforegulaceae bacterium]